MKKTIFSVAIFGVTLAANDNQLFSLSDTKQNIENHVSQSLENFANNHQTQIEAAINAGASGAEHFVRGLEKIDSLVHKQDLQFFSFSDAKQSAENHVSQSLENFANNHQTQIEAAINAGASGAEHLVRGLEKVDSLVHKQDLEFFSLSDAKQSVENHVEQGLEKFADNHQTQIEGAINAGASAAEHFVRGMEKVDSLVHKQDLEFSQIADMINKNSDDEFSFISKLENDAKKADEFYNEHQNAINSAVKTAIEVGKIIAADENDNSQHDVIVDYLSNDSNLLSLKSLNNIKETVPVKKNFLSF